MLVREEVWNLNDGFGFRTVEPSEPEHVAQEVELALVELPRPVELRHPEQLPHPRRKTRSLKRGAEESHSLSSPWTST